MIKRLLEPFNIIDKKWSSIIILVELILVILLWNACESKIIPGPIKVGEAAIKLFNNGEFYRDLIRSLGLTIKSMGIAISIALLVVYLSTIELFKPLATFISKCRYLTATGLVYVFTILTPDGHTLKMCILLFGIVPFFVTSLLFTIKDIKAEYELCITLRMNKWRTLYEIVILGKLNQVVEVMRQNFAITWIMITMAEGLAMSEGGVGTMLIKAAKYMDMSKVFALLFVILTMGVLFDVFLTNLRKWIFKYAV